MPGSLLHLPWYLAFQNLSKIDSQCVTMANADGFDKTAGNHLILPGVWWHPRLLLEGSPASTYLDITAPGLASMRYRRNWSGIY